MNLHEHGNRINDFNKIVFERRAIKKYDTSVKISRDEMKDILTKATKAPSSYNLQSWRFLVIESEEAKSKLLPLAIFNGQQYNEQQIVTSSAVIAIFGDLEHVASAPEIFNAEVKQGSMTESVSEYILEAINIHYSNSPDHFRKDVALTDGGLVAMQLMLVARSYGYDTCAMGGYDKENIAEIFGLDKERYVSVMLVSIGKADSDGRPSTRKPIADVAEWK
ncbi:nitroreductase family protein [Paenibacillus sp. JNUCC31]|uniref:nitroreductase family protein n=1 Tax=Paenibacillus sp. JNUCC-31 TaxID=2777983 RepID=UPI00178535D3|nr:nitroreductase family protein [Paenibacillus sp. JNUCC-31]QOS78884.1 nitroreductase family protein [Paenibacillus sp. JNUCC-31]